MVSDIKRLHKITSAELEEWKRERMRVGQLKYGDSDLKRYGMVDIVEELMDAANILVRFENRAKVQGYEFAPWQTESIERLKAGINEAFRAVVALDQNIPDSLCTDENGGERIWWGDNR